MLTIILFDVAIPPEVITVVGGVVTVVVGLVLHFWKVIPSKYVTLIGGVAGIAATILPKVIDTLPPKMAVIVAVVGYALALFNGRVQGTPKP